MPATQPTAVEPDPAPELTDYVHELSREEILAADDLVREQVAVPEWGKGAFVWVFALMAGERDKFEESMIDRSGKRPRVNGKDVRAKLAALAMRNAAGERLFSDPDVVALTKKSSAAMDRVYEVAQRLSKVSDDDIEELAKNSERAQGD